MSSNNLYQASNQWASRPADERFWNLTEAYQQATHYRNSSGQRPVQSRNLRIHADGNDLRLTDSSASNALQTTGAQLTHYAFGQLANRLSIPAGYLRDIPAPLAAQCVNHALETTDLSGNLLVHKNGSLVARAITSEHYARIWNSEILERLIPLQSEGWRNPPARPCGADNEVSRIATAADVLDVRTGSQGLSIQIGDRISPAGIYVSDHDMFVFLINEQNRIDDGSAQGLSRGVFVINSEVGAAAFKVVKFLYRTVCGNHIVWDASEVQELKIIHRGTADLRFGREMMAELRTYENASAYETEGKIKTAQRFEIGATKDEVLDALFARKIASRADLIASYDCAVEQADSDFTGGPRTAWGYAQGMTHYSQTKPFADDRNMLDRAAGKVIEMAL